MIHSINSQPTTIDIAVSNTGASSKPGWITYGGSGSFVITGAQTWGLVISGPNNTGRVIAWAGTAAR